MDLAKIVENEFTQKVRESIVTDDLIATRQLINSVTQSYENVNGKQTVNVFAESYILELRDGEQSEPNLQDIEVWVEAKGLSGFLDPEAVYNSILKNGTTWDRIGGAPALKEIINEENIQKVIDIAVAEQRTEILNIKWL